MGVVFALLSAASWGISNALIRRAQDNTPYSTNIGTFLTIIVNNVINICVLSVILILQGPIEITAIGIFFFAIGGLLNSCIGRSLLFSCFNRIGSARGGVIKGLMPLFVIIGGVAFLKEQMSYMMWVGIAVILVGVYTISFDTINRVGGLENYNKDEKTLLREGIIIGIISCLFLASGNLLRKVGLQYINSSVLGVTIGSFTGLLFYGMYFLIKGDKKQITLALKTFNKDYMLGGIFTSAALYLLFFSMQLIPISVTNSVAASEPLFTIIMSYLLLKNKENITYLTVTGGFLIIIGTVILMLLG